MCGQYPAVFLLDTLFLLNSLATSAANADLEYSMPLPFPIQMGKPDSRGASITCHVAVAAQTSGKFSNPAERSNHVASNNLKKKNNRQMQSCLIFLVRASGASQKSRLRVEKEGL